MGKIEAFISFENPMYIQAYWYFVSNLITYRKKSKTTSV